MNCIFDTSVINTEMIRILQQINRVFNCINSGNSNRIILIDNEINKSIKKIKKIYSCLSYNVSDLGTLHFAHDSITRLHEALIQYFEIVEHFNVKSKNMDIFEYCTSALYQIESFKNNFHYERMKFMS